MGWLSPTASICTLSAGTPARIRAWATAVARACDFWKITSRWRSTGMLAVRLEAWPTTLMVPAPPLAWKAATDDVTPSSEIVYDVYVASTSGGEDFAKPAWTTPAGVTTFKTPGLPSHGTFYFVVRARDQAGNEDANTVEVRGVDPCY